MEKVKITFLGTANAIPTKQRNHTSILVSFSSENMLFDCGEGTQRQFRYSNLSPSKINKIFITHWHGDHILGLPGLLQTLAMNEYNKTLKIYGPSGTKKFMNAIKELMINYKINIEVNEINPGIVVENKDFYVKAESMDHGIPAMAYSLVIKEKIRLDKKKIKKYKLPNTPLLGDLQQGKDIIYNKNKILAKNVTYKEKGKKLTIVLDTKMNQKAIELAKDSDILITESTFSSNEENLAKEYMHLTSKQAAEIAKKSKSKKLILTHISQRYEHNLNQIEKEAKKVFKNTIIVKDLQSIEF